MRIQQRLYAKAENITPQSLLHAKPSALLPPIQLYRRILRSHRKLPKEHRTLGDLYVKSEFQAHKDVENPVHIVGFLSEWQMYAQQIEGNSWRGEKFDKSKLDKLSDEQVTQMYELMQAIKRTVEEDGNE